MLYENHSRLGDRVGRWVSLLLQGIQNTLNAYAPSIVPPQNIRSQISFLPQRSHSSRLSSQPLPQRLGTNDKDVANLRKDFQTWLETRLNLPAFEEFDVFTDILRNQDTSGRTDVELLEMVQKERPDTQGNLGEKCGKILRRCQSVQSEVADPSEEVEYR